MYLFENKNYIRKKIGQHNVMIPSPTCSQFIWMYEVKKTLQSAGKCTPTKPLQMSYVPISGPIEGGIPRVVRVPSKRLNSFSWNY